MAKRSADIYGEDPQATANKESSRALSNPKPTLDVHGEKDSRFTKDASQGGRSGK
jgi:hypothetical protein